MDDLLGDSLFLDGTVGSAIIGIGAESRDKGSKALVAWMMSDVDSSTRQDVMVVDNNWCWLLDVHGVRMVLVMDMPTHVASNFTKKEK
jgi:hypothetical protein